VRAVVMSRWCPVILYRNQTLALPGFGTIALAQKQLEPSHNENTGNLDQYYATREVHSHAQVLDLFSG
jgi:hypothetical protein